MRLTSCLRSHTSKKKRFVRIAVAEGSRKEKAEMNLPHFNAEASLYQSIGRYQASRAGRRAEGGVNPAWLGFPSSPSYASAAWGRFPYFCLPTYCCKLFGGCGFYCWWCWPIPMGPATAITARGFGAESIG
jgi:hypothetical protein